VTSSLAILLAILSRSFRTIATPVLRAHHRSADLVIVTSRNLRLGSGRVNAAQSCRFQSAHRLRLRVGALPAFAPR
jgi:hypothetical protein